MAKLSDEERREQHQEIARQRWNRMVRREEQRVADEVVKAANAITKDAARRVA